MAEVYGLLNEHEAPSSAENHTSEYQPTPEQASTIKLVNQIFSKNKAGRKANDEKWQDYYRMFRGKQWKEQRPSYRHSEVINLIFRAIQSVIPILTDALPKPEFLPKEPSDYELSKILNDVLECDWDSNNWSYIFTECLYDSHILGTGFGELHYDPDYNDGIGGICFESPDTFYQYPDPYALDVNKRSRSYVEARPVELEVLKQKYPEYADYLEADIVDIMRREKGMTEMVSYKSPSDNRVLMEGSTAIENKNEALEIKCYYKDMEIEEEEIADKETGQISYLKKLKYPLGRYSCVVSGVLVEDRPITEKEGGKFPYLRLQNYIMAHEFWGMSEVEQLESPQKIFNKLLSFTLDVLTLMGNPIWVVDNTSGVDTDNLFNRPGLIVEKNPSSEVRREEGVQLQPYVLQMIDRMKLWFDDISGSTDVSRGAQPEGVTAASAIEALQQAQQTRLRQKSKNIDAFMQDFGQLYLSLVFENYSVPKVFRITNDDNTIKYFKFHIDQDPVDPNIKRARIKDVHVNEQGQQVEGEEKVYDIRRKFDVKISLGSALPFEKNRIEEQSIKLFQLGIIDAEEVMKNLKYPNYQAVLQRIAMQAQQQAQVEMQQQQQLQAQKGIA